METFLMVCLVAADFGPFHGEIFRVRPQDIGVLLQAPIWVKDTLLFSWMLKDGTVKVGETSEQKKKLENDPKEGTGADGKKLEEPAEEPAKEEEPVKPARRSRKKGEEK